MRFAVDESGWDARDAAEVLDPSGSEPEVSLVDMIQFKADGADLVVRGRRIVATGLGWVVNDPIARNTLGLSYER